MRTRRRFTAEFKVALEVIHVHRTLRSWRPSTNCTPHPDYGLEARGEKLAEVFDDKKTEAQAAEVTKLHAQIGRLVVKRDFLAKAFDR